MLRVALPVLVVTALLGSLSLIAEGQITTPSTVPGVCGQASNQSKVGCTLPYLYSSTGRLPIKQVGTDVFDFVSNPTALTATLGTELTTLPLTAPGSGFVFQLDRASGLEVRSTQSLGPILAERGDTIGRHKLFVAFTYQYFKFGTENGISTRSFHNVIQHETGDGLAEDSDLVSTNDAIDLKIHQITAFATFGLTDRIDVSAVVPILNVRLGASSTATIQNISSPGFPLHAFCDNATPANPCATQSFSSFRQSTGIGDVVFRVKVKAYGGEHTKLAVGSDVRVPTGDELNFRGSGTYGARPFAALSFTSGRFAPHANIGLQVNGNSILAGRFDTNTKAHLPNELTYSAGTDVGVTSRFTLAADWLGERVINGFNARQSSCSETFPPATGNFATCTAAGNAGASGAATFTFPQTVSYRASYSVNDIAVGAKISPVKNLLITLNGLFKLDDPGLRAKAVPLVGIGYTF
ncbi:MAG TPA: hypothetical protein VFO39_02970 [Candidatus Sulfotelmatobacter sp.]|nr:hypothetical protein [Candidatus Sulfotelmatobacter sp.]